MYLIHKFQQTMEYIRIYLQICTNNKKNNRNLKYISYYNDSRKEVDLAENWIPMIFPENEYYEIFVGLDGIIKGLYCIIERF